MEDERVCGRAGRTKLTEVRWGERQGVEIGGDVELRKETVGPSARGCNQASDRGEGEGGRITGVAAVEWAEVANDARTVFVFRLHK